MIHIFTQGPFEECYNSDLLQQRGFRVPVYAPSLLSKEDLEIVYMVFCKVKAYIHIISKEYRLCFTQMLLHVGVLHDGISTNIPKMLIFHLRFCLRMRRTSAKWSI